MFEQPIAQSQFTSMIFSSSLEKWKREWRRPSESFKSLPMSCAYCPTMKSIGVCSGRRRMKPAFKGPYVMRTYSTFKVSGFSPPVAPKCFQLFPTYQRVSNTCCPRLSCGKRKIHRTPITNKLYGDAETNLHLG